MDAQFVDVFKIVITGLFGAVITPLVTEIFIPYLKKRKELRSSAVIETPLAVVGGNTTINPVVVGATEQTVATAQVAVGANSEVPVPANSSITSLPKPIKKRRNKSKIGWQAGIGLVIFLLAAYFLIRPTFISPCPVFASTSVSINSPADSSNASLLTIAQGTVCHVPQDKELWLLVQAGGVAGYYPQNGPIIISNDGKWSGSVLLGGQSTHDIGRGFVIYTVLADQEGIASIQSYFKSAPNYTPLDPLPSGIELQSQIQVVRI